MWACRARGAILGLVLALAGGGQDPAWAGDLAAFNAAVESTAAHNRVAIGYLRTGNLDLALLEIDRLREAWTKLEARFSAKRPDAFDGNALYGSLWTRTNTRFAGIDLMIKMGKPEAVAASLQGLRGDLYDMRKTSGITVLADCVRDSNAAMQALGAYDGRTLDWNKPETNFGIASNAAIYGHILERCDGMAAPAIRGEPEFRRLIDGAKASLTFIPAAIATRDGNLLHRVMIELRSFDNLLSFRFG